VVCVDLDGTLIAGDLLWEPFVDLIKRHPLRAFSCLLAIFRGKARFKEKVAQHVEIDAAALPYRGHVVDLLHELHLSGAHLVLATAADQTYARAVAEHLGIFSDVIASDGRINRSGHRKAAALIAAYGSGCFDYIGNAESDVPVWRAAGGGIAIDVSPGLARHLTSNRLVDRVSSVRSAVGASAMRALRPHQWAKNLLIFVPLIASHNFFQFHLWWSAGLAFVAFSFCASAIYVLNDISDIQSDRLHARKRARPFAAGELSIPLGATVAALLLAATTVITMAAASLGLAIALVVYAVAGSAYSAVIKRKAVADVFLLTALYVLRIVAGGAATNTPLSSWLLAFALFFFLSLAFVKRYAEGLAADGSIAGRGYGSQDAMWMQVVGINTGCMAVLVLALYVNAPEIAVLYRRPAVLWLLCPLLLFWLTRFWFRAGRGLIHDDPLVEAARDLPSYAIAACVTAVFFAAI
jgi:4-hydroxybenzoate polyprenyltransferase/phosphoserine phosphatase